MVGADERELHSWQNNQLSRRVSKAAGTRSTVSLRKPIFAIGFERASRYTVQRERERERNKGSKATLLKLLEKFLVRPTPPLFPSNSRDPTSNEAAPPYDPSAKGIDSCSVLCAITTTLEYKSTGPMETTEPLDQEGGIPMERGLIAEWKNWQQLRYRWLIDSELNP